MKECLSENEDQLSQLAKGALKSLKLKSDPESLYLVQIMSWVLKEKPEQFNRDNLPDLLDQVEYLERLQPKASARYLFQVDEKGCGLFMPDEDLKPLCPEELGVHLVNQLHDLMASSDTGYPPNPPWPVYPMT